MYCMKITFTIQFRGYTRENANLNPRDIVNFLKYAKIHTCENSYVRSMSAQDNDKRNLCCIHMILNIVYQN